MASGDFNKFDCFVTDLVNGVYTNLDSDTIKAMLTNSEPVVTNTVYANITQIANGNGYTTGGVDISATYSEASGVGTMGSADYVEWTASGSMGPFRYVVLYDDTVASPAKPLIGWYDYGASLTLAAGEKFRVDFGANILTIS